LFHRCQFCRAPLVIFKQQGIGITARLHETVTLVPASALFACLIRLPDMDLSVLGLGDNHPVNAIMKILLVLPPVSRPHWHSSNRVRVQVSRHVYHAHVSAGWEDTWTRT
jgi:hypothetical protein